ncbi:TPA: hypothetical protein H1016_03440 [archaeon]|uniref:Uncharacterized protein n=1 Tax=Candidatus Naiadarchaeum limnaeum TaxID=2756139 RepID=A0A832V422_9ARCH|nr:hypothetical protein [Candidatus Naiadarchaeum limnaeum]
MAAGASSTEISRATLKKYLMAEVFSRYSVQFFPNVIPQLVWGARKLLENNPIYDPRNEVFINEFLELHNDLPAQVRIRLIVYYLAENTDVCRIIVGRVPLENAIAGELAPHFGNRLRKKFKGRGIRFFRKMVKVKVEETFKVYKKFVQLLLAPLWPKTQIV